MPFDGNPEKKTSALERRIELAQAILEKEGWRRCSLGGSGVPKCLLGALFSDEIHARLGPLSISRLMVTMPALNKALQAEAKARGIPDNGGNWGLAVAWNDVRAESAADAIDFLESVKARVKELEYAV